MSGERSTGCGSTDIRVQLLDGFAVLVQGVRTNVPACTRRVIAFLALHDRCEARERVAGRLWADADPRHGMASLRTALWRIRRISPAMIEAGRDTAGLSGAVQVDVRASRDLIDEVLTGRPVDPQAAISLFHRPLLPGWDDDWVLLERERLRHLQLCALEALSRRLTCEGHFGYALLAANTAVHIDPLRESAQRTAIEAHIAEGNLAEACRVYQAFRQLLRRELGVEPSTGLRALLAARVTTT
jgi:DNA-binding SARP family transcriptional activator